MDGVRGPVSGSTVTSPVRTLAGGKIIGTILRMEVWVDSTKLYSTLVSSELDATVGVHPGPAHSHRFHGEQGRHKGAVNVNAR